MGSSTTVGAVSLIYISILCYIRADFFRAYEIIALLWLKLFCIHCQNVDAGLDGYTNLHQGTCMTLSRG